MVSGYKNSRPGFSGGDIKTIINRVPDLVRHF